MLRANVDRIALAVGLAGAIAVFVGAARIDMDGAEHVPQLLGDAAGASWLCLATAWAAGGWLALCRSAVGAGLVVGASFFVLTMVGSPTGTGLEVALAGSHALTLSGAVAIIVRTRAQWRFVLSGAAVGMAAPFLVLLVPWLYATDRPERWARGAGVVLLLVGTIALARGRTWAILALALAPVAFSAPEIFPNAIPACFCWSHPLTASAGSFSGLIALSVVPWLVPIARWLARPGVLADRE